MNILVTGGTGMTGAHLLLKLSESGHNIKALKRQNSKTDITKKIFNYKRKNGDELFSKIEWLTGDLTDFNSVNDAMKNIDIVYHTAAYVSFKPSDRDFIIYNNVKGTANIVNAALINNVKKLCHVSSVSSLGSLYGDKEQTEDAERINLKTSSAYAVSKYHSEREVWRASAEGLDIIIVNPSVILGPGNWKQSSPRMIKVIWDGLKYYTNGGTGFVDVEDVVNIMIKLTESEISNERFILNSENLSFKHVFNIIADSLNKKRPHIYASGFMLHSLKTFDKLRYLLSGTEPRLTKHTLHSSQHTVKYSNKKIKQVIEYDFKPIDESLKNICNIFLSDIDSNL